MPNQPPLWARILDDLRGPSLDDLAENPYGIPDDVNPWHALGFDPQSHLPLWFPQDWNDLPLSQQQRLRWFEELLSRYSPGWNEWAPGEDPTSNKQEIATSLYRILHDLELGTLPDPSFIPDKSTKRTVTREEAMQALANLRKKSRRHRPRILGRTRQHCRNKSR